jgi:hypothetical protein
VHHMQDDVVARCLERRVEAPELVRVVVHDYAGRVLVARAERAGLVVVGAATRPTPAPSCWAPSRSTACVTPRYPSRSCLRPPDSNAGQRPAPTAAEAFADLRSRPRMRAKVGT